MATTIFFGTLGVGVAAFFGMMVFPKGRVLLKSVFEIFFQSRMQDPRIIEQVYNQKIDKLRDVYTKANNSCQQAHGKLRKTKNRIEELKRSLEEARRTMTMASNRGDVEGARNYGRDAMTAEQLIATFEKEIPGLEQAISAAETLRERAARAITQMETEKTTTIAKAELGKAKKEIYDSFDPNAAATTIDKILADYSKFADRQEEMGMGAEAAWESSPEAMKIAADKRATEYSVDAYIAEFMKTQGEVKPSNN